MYAIPMLMAIHNPTKLAGMLCLLIVLVVAGDGRTQGHSKSACQATAQSTTVETGNSCLHSSQQLCILDKLVACTASFCKAVLRASGNHNSCQQMPLICQDSKKRLHYQKAVACVLRRLLKPKTASRLMLERSVCPAVKSQALAYPDTC